MEKRYCYYEIKCLKDCYGLVGKFDSSEQALQEINNSYLQAKERGFDNKHEKWAIIYNEGCRTYNAAGEFLKEELKRVVVEQAEYSEYEAAYVFVY